VLVRNTETVHASVSQDGIGQLKKSLDKIGKENIANTGAVIKIIFCLQQKKAQPTPQKILLKEYTR